MLFIVVLMVALLYYATPNVKQPKFRWVSIGAALAIVTWIVLSAAFGFYVANFSSYDKTYGSLAAVIVFLLWLWLTNLALLFGAELDAELERGRELQSGVAAEENIQLPARDDRNIKKSEKKEQEDVDSRPRPARRARGRRRHRQGLTEQGRGDPADLQRVIRRPPLGTVPGNGYCWNPVADGDAVERRPK